MKSMMKIYEETHLNEANYKALSKRLEDIDDITKVSILHYLLGRFPTDPKFLTAFEEAIDTFA